MNFNATALPRLDPEVPVARVFAVVPACNEADAIASTIASLHRQTTPPDLTVVVPNNCTDATAAVAERAGACVLPYPGHNPDRKAGAINYGLARLEHLLRPGDAVLVMDADTTLSPDFLAIARYHMSGRVGGCGGTFAGRDSRTVLGYLQRMEFYRYGQTTRRNGHRAFVLTGTGTLFSWDALRQVRAARHTGTGLPAGASFYDTHSLTEDNELTFALQTLGYRTICPAGMVATTDVMESVGKLIAQRERWYLGALRNIWHYGRRMPGHLRWVYWRQQIGLGISATITVAYLVMVAGTVAVTGAVAFSWWWTLPCALLSAERTMTVWGMGRRARWYAVAFVPEQLYTLLLTWSYLRALRTFLRGGKGGWHAT
ncbi:glycosyltransferase family 2 protein [Actinoplanes sp. NPDC026619]|uniref:glycosyltransferase family 2 protein n=1 Tax=Actinoplanes sp. NPDC026619 TaxID=3155798 RepID=UPI0033C066D6